MYIPNENGLAVTERQKVLRQYLIVGRGAAKSLYETFLILSGDRYLTTTHQITTALTMKQAEEVVT